MTGEGRADSSDDEATATIDLDVWNELRLLGEPDGENFLVDLVDGFVDDARRGLALLATAVDGGDAVGTASLAHSLKGSSAQLGFQRLSATCASLERLARTGSLAGAAAEMQQLRWRYSALCRAVAVTLRPVLDHPATPG